MSNQIINQNRSVHCRTRENIINGTFHQLTDYDGLKKVIKPNIIKSI